jgi:peptidoglycan/LPS O-acetylase OafA/YrhL
MSRFDALDGLRVIFSFLIVSGHAYFFSSWRLKNAQQTLQFARLFPLSWIAFGAFVSVSAFFALSGFLLAQSVLRRRNAFSVVGLARLVLHRLLRLLPIAVMVAIIIKYGLGEHKCCFNWDILFLANMIDLSRACNALSWSLTVGVQAWLIVVAIVAVCGRNVERIQRMLLVVIGLMCVYSCTVWYLEGATPLIGVYTFTDAVEVSDFHDLEKVVGPAAFNVTDPERIARFLQNRKNIAAYTQVLRRGSSLLIGTLAGFLVSSIPQKLRSIGPLLLFSGIAIVSACLTLNPYAHAPDYAIPQFTYYNVLCTEFLAVGVSVIAIDVSLRPNSFIATVLSSRIFAFLAPFTYPIYLLHMYLALAVWIAIPPVFAEPSPASMVFKSIQLYALAFVISIPLYWVDEKIFQRHITRRV